MPGILAYRNIALRAVSEGCKLAQMDWSCSGGDLEAQAVSAVGEAFNNVAIHAYRGVDAGLVDLRIDWTADDLVIELTDTGHGFDPGEISPPDLDDLPESGMGLFIIRSFMDDVSYRPGPPNTLRMVKHRIAEPDLDDAREPQRSSAVDLIDLGAAPGPVTLSAARTGDDGSTSRSDWRIKVQGPASVGGRVAGGMKRA
ncbi:MAG: ATP-binding protein [Byssovorax sp.]